MTKLWAAIVFVIMLVAVFAAGRATGKAAGREASDLEYAPKLAKADMKVHGAEQAVRDAAKAYAEDIKVKNAEVEAAQKEATTREQAILRRLAAQRTEYEHQIAALQAGSSVADNAAEAPCEVLAADIGSRLAAIAPTGG